MAASKIIGQIGSARIFDFTRKNEQGNSETCL